MKKFGVIILSVIMVLGSSACNINSTINTDSEPKSSAEATEMVAMPETSQQSVDTKPSTNNVQGTSDTNAFYGVWCCGSESESDANNFASQLLNQGFDAHVFVTTDWANLNPEKYYVVTAGICSTKEQAERLLRSVKDNGYSDAYIKYTGERK